MRRHSAAVLGFLSLVWGCDPGPLQAPTQPPRDLESLLVEFDGLVAGSLFVEGGNLLSPWIASFPVAERGAIELKVASAYHRGRVHELALKHAENALAAGMSTPEAFYILGDSQRALFQPEAKNTLEKLLAQSPAHHLGQLSLARACQRVGETEQALKLFGSYFQAARRDEQDYPVALLEYARVLRSAGKLQEAADRFAVLLEDNPLDAKVYSELASTLYRLRLRKEGKFVEEIYKAVAQNSFEEHIEVRLRERGITALALGQEGANRMRQRRYLDAFRAYYAGVRADPREPRLRIFLADLLLQFRRFRDLHAVLDEGLRSRPELASGMLWKKGLAHLEKHEFPAAFDVLSHAGTVLSQEGEQGGEERGQASLYPLNLALAWAAIEIGNLPAATAAIATAESAQPAGWETAYWRGRVELLQGHAENALSQFDNATQRGARDWMDLEYFRALAMARQGRKQEAAGLLRRVIEKKPSFDQAYATLLEIGVDDPALRAEVESAAARLQDLRAQVRAREATIDARPLETCGLEYLELGKLSLKSKTPGAFDAFFLAADLAPDNVEVCQLLVAGLRQNQEVFVRLQYLRRLLRLEPGNEGARAALADTYIKLHVRLDEAEKLATSLHSQAPSAISFRLLGQVQLRLGKRQEALEILRAGKKAHPGDAALSSACQAAEIEATATGDRP